MSRERRKHPRFDLKQLVELRFDREKTMQVFSVNVSQAGLRCTSSDRCDLYSRVFFLLEYAISGAKGKIRGEGIVIRAQADATEENWDLGIQIIGIDMEDQESFEILMRDLPLS